MKLYITYNRYKFVFILPCFLVLNGLVAFKISIELRKKNICLSSKAICKFFKSLKKEIKLYKKLTIVNVKTNSGVKIQIKF